MSHESVKTTPSIYLHSHRAVMTVLWGFPVFYLLFVVMAYVFFQVIPDELGDVPLFYDFMTCKSQYATYSREFLPNNIYANLKFYCLFLCGLFFIYYSLKSFFFIKKNNYFNNFRSERVIELAKLLAYLSLMVFLFVVSNSHYCARLVGDDGRGIIFITAGAFYLVFASTPFFLLPFLISFVQLFRERGSFDV